MKSPFLNEVFNGQDLIDWKEFLEESFDEELFDKYNEDEDKDDSILKDEENYEDWKTVCIFIDGCNDYIEDKTFIHDSYIREYIEDMVKDCYNLDEIPDFIQNHINWDSLYDSIEADYSMYDSYYYY